MRLFFEDDEFDSHAASRQPRRQERAGRARILTEYTPPAGDIVSPTLVTAQAEDRETRRLYVTITAPKVLVEFASDEGAWGHCEGAAPALYDQRTYDWLDRVPAR